MSEEIKNSVKYKIFRGSGEMSWDKLLLSAAEFASALGIARVLSVSHSSDQGSGTVVVWYKEEGK